MALLEPLNATLPANRQITDACVRVRKHRKRHFNLQAPAAAIWRRVLDDRAADPQGAYEDGVTNLLTAAGFFEVMMREGFATMVAEDTVISQQEGAWAAKQLHEITKEDSGGERRGDPNDDNGFLTHVLTDAHQPLEPTRLTVVDHHRV